MIQVRPALRSRTILVLQFSLEACISACVQDNDQGEGEGEGGSVCVLVEWRNCNGHCLGSFVTRQWTFFAPGQ